MLSRRQAQLATTANALHTLSVLLRRAGHQATVTGGDEQYTNGVVHHIDAVLMPAKAGSAPAVGQKVGK